MSGTEQAVGGVDRLDQLDEANLKLGEARLWADILGAWCVGDQDPDPDTLGAGRDLIIRSLRECLQKDRAKCASAVPQSADIVAQSA